MGRASDENGDAPREYRWSEALAVGSLAFVESVKNDLGVKAAHREVLAVDGTYALREPSEAYTRNLTSENEALMSQNTFFWNEIVDEATIELGPTRNIWKYLRPASTQIPSSAKRGMRFLMARSTI